MEQSSLKGGYFIESGSWSHGTGIKKKSDVDYMSWCSGSRPEYPSSALRQAKDAISGCDWRITDLSVSSPVVKVEFATEPKFEIAPVRHRKVAPASECGRSAEQSWPTETANTNERRSPSCWLFALSPMADRQGQLQLAAGTLNAVTWVALVEA